MACECASSRRGGTIFRACTCRIFFIYLYIRFYVCARARCTSIIILLYLYPWHGNRGRNEIWTCLVTAVDPEHRWCPRWRSVRASSSASEKQRRRRRRTKATFRRRMATAERYASAAPMIMLFVAMGTCSSLCVRVWCLSTRSHRKCIMYLISHYYVSCAQRRRRFRNETTTAAGITRTFGVVKGEPSSAAVVDGATSITATWRTRSATSSRPWLPTALWPFTRVSRVRAHVYTAVNTDFYAAQCSSSNSTCRSLLSGCTKNVFISWWLNKI